MPRTAEEAAAPVTGPLADLLELLHCGLTHVPSPYELALKRTGDVESFAEHYTAFTRAFSESSLTQGVFVAGRGKPADLADRFYEMMRSALAAKPDAYRFDDLTLAIVVRRRD